MQEDSEGFLYPKVDTEICNNCGMCDKVCPILNKTAKKNNTKAYACMNSNLQQRVSGSSGGIFSLLAEAVVNKGGVVFGAGFNDNLVLEHSSAETLSDYKRFIGSKYVQSNILNTYKEAKEFLTHDRTVLFSGTPCQTNGLKYFLRRDYEKLIAVDIVCHGTPSPKVLKKYISETENKFKKKIANIRFRDKVKGWRQFSLTNVFEDGTSSSRTLAEDDYLKGFLRNLYLRPSCHDCQCNGIYRCADITLADYWGEDPGLSIYDDRGISLVLTHTKKGEDVFSAVSEKMEVKESDLDYAVKFNSPIVKSVPAHKNREKFFGDMEKLSLGKLIKKHTENRVVAITNKPVHIIKNIIKKIIRKKK
jgi:coenzyme F420-reducing hydrogenase beta subunit